MPTINYDIEFEVYCGICGSGCCGDTDISRPRNGHYAATVTVTCSTCQGKISELEKKVNDLENELNELAEKI